MKARSSVLALSLVRRDRFATDQKWHLVHIRVTREILALQSTKTLARETQVERNHALCIAMRWHAFSMPVRTRQPAAKDVWHKSCVGSERVVKGNALARLPAVRERVPLRLYRATREGLLQHTGCFARGLAGTEGSSVQLGKAREMAKRIMVIDDSAALREAVCGTLSDAGYEVVEAMNGTDALAKLDGRKLDLMICDVLMPGMDGIALVKEVKRRAAYRFVPIIMLTTESSEESKEAGQMAGAKAWVVKPFRPAQILNAVSKLVL
jgi:two-component system chemotaxis response regulator CheY